MNLQVQREVELLEQAGSSSVVVVGTGPAGVELATTVADRLGRTANIQLISTGEIRYLERLLGGKGETPFKAKFACTVSNRPLCNSGGLSIGQGCTV